MRRTGNLSHPKRAGSALILSLIFIVMFSALATAMAAMSGANIQIAENQRKLDTTRACAESGLEVIRYWMNTVEISGTTPDNQRFSQLASTLQAELTAAGIENLVPVVNGSTVRISDVPLDSSGQSFTAVLTGIDPNTVRLEVTGNHGSLYRTIRTNYAFDTRANTVFDFGVASKGPITLAGNVELEGVNIEVESNAYIESPSSLLALSITGNSHIAGNVKIVNPSAYVHLQGGQAGIGGETGADAMNHVEIGAPPAEFPEMDPDPFIAYAEANGSVVTAAQANQSNATFTNPIIRANTNPTFSNGTRLKGVIFVEAPNTVTFAGHASVTGVIVTNGDPTDDSGTNELDFQGTVDAYAVETLPAGEFGTWLPQQRGTFIMAPGFRASFGGNFEAQTGAIAANGIEFYGSAGGTINGSIINYANSPMTLQGNTDLYFNRSGLTEVPAGFVPEIILRYDAASYAEVL